MEQDNKKKKKIIGISLGVVGALLLLFSGTYAYWQLTKEQSSANEIVAACLDFELSDVTEAISLERAYPISEEESESLTGYTFKVINNCNDSIDYMIGLNSITNSSENYLANTSLRVKLDNGSSRIYETLNDIEYIENVRYSKELGTSTIQGNSENTHLLKVWVDENAPVTEQGKSFTGKIIITGSVGNTSGEQIADSCFTIASDGTILDYDHSCGSDVVVPSTINGIQVKSISSIAFKEGTIYLGWYVDKITGRDVDVAVITDNEHRSKIERDILLRYLKYDDSEIVGKTLSDFITVYNTVDEMLTALAGKEYELDVETYDAINEERVGVKHNITSLDLSNAVYLESVGNMALYNETYESEVNEGPHCVFWYSSYVCNESLLTTVIFPENGMLTTIGKHAFSGNRITNIVFPSTVTDIQDYAFEDNELTSITLPDGLTRIGDSVFGYNKLTNITIPSTVEVIDHFAFINNQITKIVIPSNVTTIGRGAFEENPLTEVIIKRPSTAGISINYNAFYSSVTNTELTPIYNPNYTE